MFLKSLTLKGFKSFAEPTTLEMEPGITVVVGPNGSGKSNVVDAIAWVLGAQAPSAVRSQKMDDVIFAGTGSRAALGRAEVSLTIDNGAGLLPIEFSEVTITRTLFRAGDSEYALNGVPCRLLDIQELLSDTGVGRQQHVIVSQGQIDAVLNARPEERRLIIEEAAGVLKFRRRKERSERRLAATEVNLVRLGDLLREVRRQLRPLERQADAARRHDGVASELRALRAHLAGRELAALRGRLQAGAARRAEARSDEGALKASLVQLDQAVQAGETRLGAFGHDDLGDALVRFESLREKGAGLAAVLAERRRGLVRDRLASVEETVVASLESESARLATERARIDADGEVLAPESAALAAAQAALDAERGAVRPGAAGAADGAVPATTLAAEARAELGARREALARGAAELARIRRQVEALDRRGADLAADHDRLRAELAGAAASGRAAVAAEGAARDERAGAEAELALQEGQLRDADAERHAWVARAEALAQALDEARDRAGTERLAGVSGVVGTLLDVVEIDAGYVDAFVAAAGEALEAVVLADAGAGRNALEALQRAGARGAVLVLSLDRGPAAPRPRPGAPGPWTPLRDHVRSARADVERLLDELVGTTVVVEGGWEVALDAALARPDLQAVSRAGDRFGPGGWRIGRPGPGVTAAALHEARARAGAAVLAAAEAEGRATTGRDRLGGARRAEGEAASAVEELAARRARWVDEQRRVDADATDTGREAEALRGELDELAATIGRDRGRVAHLEAVLPALVAEESGALEQARAESIARRRLDERAAELDARRTDLEVRSAALRERRAYTDARRAEVEDRLARHQRDRERAAGRRLELDAKLVATDRLAAVVTDRAATVASTLVALRARRGRRLDAVRAVTVSLEALRRQRAGDERSLEEVRERVRRAELDEAETRLRLEAAAEACRRDLDCEPDAAVVAPCPPLPAGATAASRARELERELRLMGPINSLAIEELDALRERHEFLQGQLDDVRSSRRELGRVIRAIDTQIVEVFSAAWAEVAEHFSALFETLFPGGRGRLVLTDPDNPLDTGIEVEARPSGKNVRKLSLLSGGERSLTALAYLFAVFRSRPSPFYVMDEVEAALDDVNLHRFLDLIHEFRDEAQLIVVSHQKRTMEAADCLYGVTMQVGGSSRVISERVSTGAGARRGA